MASFRLFYDMWTLTSFIQNFTLGYNGLDFSIRFKENGYTFMKRSRLHRHTLPLATLLCLSTFVSPFPAQAWDTPFSLFSNQTQASTLNNTHFQLKNGLNVYLSRNPLEPRFYAQVVINAGGKQDPADATGIAHYLEHMLFKGTTRLGTSNFEKEKGLQDQIVALYEKLFTLTDPTERNALLTQINDLSVEASTYAIPGELDTLYSKMGAEGMNAYTSNEETVYLLSLPKNRLEQWAMIESERFREPVFRLFQSELETVYEEKNISLDDKDDILREAVDAQVFKKHPYGSQTILGSVEHLKNPSLRKMYAFYNTYYVPNNMALVISGDIDIAETRRIIEKYFSDWKPSPVKPFEAPKDPPIQGIERVNVQYKGEEKVMLGFTTANRYNKDSDALTMIDMLLDSGDVGLLKLNLVQTQKVRSAGSSPSINKDAGVQYLWAVPRQGQTMEEVEALLLEQIERIKQGKFDPEVMQAIALDTEISLKRSLESNQGRAAIMSEAFLNGISVETLMQRPERLRKLTVQDVMRVANTYFKGNYVAGHRKDAEFKFPKISKPQLKKMQLNPDQQSDFALQVEALQPQPVAPEWVDLKTQLTANSYAPGVISYAAKNPINDLYTLGITYDYGRKHDPNFCTVMSELNNAGTTTQSPESVANAFYKLGTKVNFNCNDYGFSMYLSGTDKKLEPALKLAEEVLWSGQLDAKRFKARLQDAIDSRVDEKKDNRTLRSALRDWVRYGKESGYLQRSSAETLKQLSTEAYGPMKTALQKQNFKIYYSGSKSQEEVHQLLRKYHQPGTIPLPLLNARPQPPLKTEQHLESPIKVYFLHNPSAQATIDLIQSAPEVNAEEKMLVDFYNQYMDGGMGAIMFQEVREARALAYSTFSYYAQGKRLGDEDQMLAFIGTQGDKTVESLTLLIDLMRNPPESDQHFNRARQALENMYRTDRVTFRNVFGTMEAWHDWGFANDPRPQFFAQLSKTQLKDMMAFLKQRVASKPLVFAIVGDREKVNLPALKKLAPVEEVNVSQLFKD